MNFGEFFHRKTETIGKAKQASQVWLIMQCRLPWVSINIAKSGKVLRIRSQRNKAELRFFTRSIL